MVDQLSYYKAVEDFREERRMAAIQEILGRITGKSINLLSFDDVARKLKISGGSDKGLQDIPVRSIIGSVSRYTDFTRSFLPRNDSDQNRWAKVKAAILDTQVGLPPIEVYKVGDGYFVKDGHHRVSVARQLNFEYIQAQVTEINTRVPFSQDTSPDELILKAEYADFLEHTRIDILFPDAVLKLTVPGFYQKLEEHIQVHCYFMGIDLKRDISYEEAVKHWYEEVYLPVQRAIKEKGILRDFPGRTETDLYIWVSEHQYILEKELGWYIRPEVAATDLASRTSPRLTRVFQRIGDKIYKTLVPDPLESSPTPGQWHRTHTEPDDCLFKDILVPVNGQEEGWSALEQAVIMSRCTGTSLNGLHIVPDPSLVESKDALSVRQEFQQRCQAAGFEGGLAVVSGEVAPQVCEWALLNDLVILNLAHPPASEILARLGSGFRTIIRRCSRPILAVPGQVSPMNRLLLAFDGSLKAKEALYISAFFAGKWNASLVVLTTQESGHTTTRTIKTAEKYLAERQVSAKYIEKTGSAADNIMQVAAEEESNLLLMGGYGFSPMVEAVLGSTVDQVLRSTLVPVLICQ